MKAIFNNFKIKKGYIILLFLLPTLCLAQSQNESTQEQSELKKKVIDRMQTKNIYNLYDTVSKN